MCAVLDIKRLELIFLVGFALYKYPYYYYYYYYYTSRQHLVFCYSWARGDVCTCAQCTSPPIIIIIIFGIIIIIIFGIIITIIIFGLSKH